MDFQPFSNGCDRSLVGIRRGVWSMEDTHLTEQEHTNTGTFTLAYFGTQRHKQRFDVIPTD